MSSLKRPASVAFDSLPLHPFILYGTPLPPSETHSLHPWKQSLTDDRGRPKRLHGAFTGGWSAGYHNTVGSKEGWTPASFISSRTSRHVGQQKGAAVEDFMDEEDLREREEGRTVETRGVFAGLGGRGDESVATITGESFFRPVGVETMGVKLLQRMGWRVGQGIGAKVRRRAKGDREGADLYWFAPEDVGVVDLGHKTDRRGLGFVGEGRLGDGDEIAADEDEHEEEEEQRGARIIQPRSRNLLQAKQQRKKGQGLGVGVLGSDDEEEDPYAMGPRIIFTRFAGKDDKNKAKVKKKKPISGTVTTQQHPSSFVQQPGNKSHDTRPPLPGFHLALNSLTPVSDSTKTDYTPPPIPPGWKPTRPTFNLTNPRPDISAVPQDPTTRGNLLNSPPLSEKKSVFDFLTPATRDHLAAATQNPHLPPGKGEKGGNGSIHCRDDKDRSFQPNQQQPDLAPQTAAAALQRVHAGDGGPYADDPGKRERYINFLTAVCAGEAGAMRGEEEREFAQVAVIFRLPVAGGVIGTRFTTASTSSTTTNTTNTTYNSNSTTTLSGRDGKEVPEEDPAMQAAKMGMYGPLTRSRVRFEPGRLVCKRFGVRAPPIVGGDGPQEGAGEIATGKESLARVKGWAPPDPPREEAGVTVGGFDLIGATPVRSAGGAEPTRVDAERNEALEGRRAGEAVFRAIFGSDDEEED
ncbi:hypothetical protein M433DRAFT_135905 [Acidomyces richmondensis BFW]|nr:MAG: hypothetical protein FE78DRAFT_72004 [Acidomyces sp. 'richmondensis']KYG44046.1 hypothetical protein M433DRAFT_135905 [Acidomyces richmondensis BFW]